MRKTCETGQGFPSKSRHLNKKFSKQIQDVRVPQKTQQHTQGRTTLTMCDVHRGTGVSAELETTVTEAKLDEAADVVRVSFLLQKSFRYVLETTGNPKGLEKKKGQDQTGVWKRVFWEASERSPGTGRATKGWGNQWGQQWLRKEEG